jgi:ABC-type glycerol-3-phosphate transport system substrate-binding protein
MKKKLICLLMLVAIAIAVAATAAGCSDMNNQVKETSSAATESGTPETDAQTEESSLFIKIKDDLPETMNFNKDVVTILVRGQNERYFDEFYVTDYSGDVVNDAIYNREISVEGRLNVDLQIAFDDGTSGHGPWEWVSKYITSGACEYDIIAGSNYFASRYAVRGEYYNLKNIDNLNLDKQYWAQGIIDKMTVSDALYMTTGSISTYLYDSTFVIYFNKYLCESNGLDIAGIYNTVYNGEWTLDKMIAMTSDIYSDLNGDGKRDAGDLYGFGLQVTSATDGLWSSCNIGITDLASDGSITFIPDIDKINTVVTKMNNFLWNTKGCVALAEGASYVKDNIYLFDRQFADDKLLFVTDWLYSASTNTMRGMTSEYGIIPYPKYDADQEDYYSFVHDKFTVIGIPVTVKDTAEIGAVLEAMASEGQNTVMPAYYEVALTSKYVSDEDSVNMLNTIISNIRMDRAWIFAINVNAICAKILRNQIWYNTSLVTSTYKSNYSAVSKGLATISTEFEKFRDN